MRTLNLIALTVLAAGAVGLSKGRGTANPAAVDMTTVDITPGIVSGSHLAHWPAPVDGSPHSMAWDTVTASASAGTMVIEIAADAEVLCSLEVPCNQAAMTIPSVACPDATITRGQRVDIQMTHTCSPLPTGTLTGLFVWRP